MADLDKAVADLVWFSERLSGVLSLKDTIKDYASLSNQIQELKVVIPNLQGEISNLEQKRDSVIAETVAAREEANTSIEDARKQSKKIITIADTEAGRLISIAKEEAYSLIKEVELNKKNIEDEIASLQVQVNSMNAERVQSQKSLEAVKSELSNIISKIGR